MTGDEKRRRLLRGNRPQPDPDQRRRNDLTHVSDILPTLGEAIPHVEKSRISVEKRGVSTGKPVEKPASEAILASPQSEAIPHKSEASPHKSEASPHKSEASLRNEDSEAIPHKSEAIPQKARLSHSTGEAIPQSEASLSRYKRYEKYGRKTDKCQLNIRIDSDLKRRAMMQAAHEGMDFAKFVWDSLEMRIAHKSEDSLLIRCDDYDSISLRDAYARYIRPWKPQDDLHYAKVASLPSAIRFAGFYNALLRKPAKDIGSFAYIATVIRSTEKEHAAGQYPDIESYALEVEQLVRKKYGS